MNTKAPSRKRLSGPKAERTRTGIKAATLELLREKPVKEIALEEICKRAQITQGALYFHFRNKEAAIEETLSDVIERFQERLMGIEAGDVLYPFIYRIVREFMPGLSWYRLLPSLYVVRNGSERLNQQWSELRRNVVDRICDCARTAQKAEGKPIANTRVIVEFLLSGLEGAWEHVVDPEGLGAAPPQREITAVAIACHRALMGSEPDRKAVAAMKERKMTAARFVIYP